MAFHSQSQFRFDAANAKPRRGLGGAITRARQNALKDVDKRIAEMEDARRKLRAEQRQAYERSLKNAQQDAWAIMIRQAARAIVPGYRMLLAGEGHNDVRFDMNVDAGHMPNPSRWWALNEAYYDFNRKCIATRFIAAGRAQDSMPMPNHSDARRAVSVLKGVLQHEMGHVRFTIPFPELGLDSNEAFKTWNMLEDQRMETLVVAQASVVTHYFTDMVSDVLLADPDYFDTAWLLLAGREYLPNDIRDMSAQRFAQYVNIYAPTSMVRKYGKRCDVVWKSLVDAYKAAATTTELAAAVGAAHAFIADLNANLPRISVPGGVDKHDSYRSAQDHTTYSRRVPPSPKKVNDLAKDLIKESIKDAKEQEKKDGAADKSQEKQDDGPSQNGQGMDQSGDQAPGGEQQAGDGEASGKQSDSEQSSGTPSTGYGADPEAREVFRDAVRRAQDEAREYTDNDDSTVAEASQTMRNLKRLTKTGQVRIPYLPTTVRTIPECALDKDKVAEGNVIATAARRALATVVTEAAPVWHSRQEEGYIDPLAYRTREVGQRDYRRRLTGEYGAGLDLHVSVLMDVSGSMGGHEDALGTTAYGLKLACDALPGVTSDFVYWSSGQVAENGAGEAPLPERNDRRYLYMRAPYYRVWKDGEQPYPFRPFVGGGTDPMPALRDVMYDDSAASEKSHHLVIVMSDGEWGAARQTFSAWVDRRDVTFMTILYRPGYKNYYDDDHRFSRVTDAHHEVVVDSLSEMGPLLVKGIKKVRARMSNG